MRLLFCLGCLIFPSVLQHANAERAPSLYQLAANYENSVRNFQDVTKRLRGLNAADRRAITQLLRESRQLRAAAKNPLPPYATQIGMGGRAASSRGGANSHLRELHAQPFASGCLAVRRVLRGRVR